MVSRPLDFADWIVDGGGSFLSWFLFVLGRWLMVAGKSSDVGEGVFDGLFGAAFDGGFMVVEPVLHFRLFHV